MVKAMAWEMIQARAVSNAIRVAPATRWSPRTGEETMPKRCSIAIALLVVAGVTAAAAQDPAAAPPTVTSFGEAVIRRPPDRAIITFSTNARGQTPQEAQAKGAVAMKSLQAAVEGLSLPGGQFMTTGLYVSENWEMVNNARVREGYLANHTIVVRFDDVGRAGEVMTVATSAGATGVGGVRFDRRDREALEEEALKAAVAVARARADALAAGAGRTVDRILRITEERAAMAAAGPDASVRYAAMESVTVGGGAVPVASGEIEIRMRVLLTATLK
jgi:uncharacterized protein